MSRIAALAVVFSLLIAFITAAFTHTNLEPKVVIAFLSIAFALLFGPATAYGIQIIKRRSDSSSD